MLIKLKKRDQKMGFAFGGVSLLLSPFAKILSATLLVSLLASGGFSVYKMVQVKNLKIELLQSQNELVRVTSELTACTTKLDQQNKDILNIMLDAEEDVNLVKNVNKQLDNATKIQKGEIDRLKMATAPLSCEEAQTWLKDNVGVYK
jgi:hypothetical protein